MKSFSNILILAILTALAAMMPATVFARTTLKSICRLKGQEENTLQGLGIVVGLRGTGDGSSFLPTVRSLEKTMKVMGEPLGRKGLEEIKDTKNVALVMVTAKIPAAGARQGDKIDCVVSSIGSAKSLAGGRLFLTPMVGPDKNNPRIFAFAEGPITLDDIAITTTGKVFEGCQLEEEFFNAFIKDNRITLVLDKYHASFQVAQSVAEVINDNAEIQLGAKNPKVTGKIGTEIARAINQGNIEVIIPSQYRSEPVNYISQILNLPITEPQTTPRVVINERAGSIVIDGNVEIGAVVITHKNIVVETGNETPARAFVPLDTSENGSAKLLSLTKALNALHVAAADQIDIIKGLHKDGKLHGELVIE